MGLGMIPVAGIFHITRKIIPVKGVTDTESLIPLTFDWLNAAMIVVVSRAFQNNLQSSFQKRFCPNSSSIVLENPRCTFLTCSYKLEYALILRQNHYY
jgi:hypothetical protein